MSNYRFLHQQHEVIELQCECLELDWEVRCVDAVGADALQSEVAFVFRATLNKHTINTMSFLSLLDSLIMRFFPSYEVMKGLQLSIRKILRWLTRSGPQNNQHVVNFKNLFQFFEPLVMLQSLFPCRWVGIHKRGMETSLPHHECCRLSVDVWTSFQFVFAHKCKTFFFFLKLKREEKTTAPQTKFNAKSILLQRMYYYIDICYNISHHFGGGHKSVDVWMLFDAKNQQSDEDLLELGRFKNHRRLIWWTPKNTWTKDHGNVVDAHFRFLLIFRVQHHL